MTKERIKKLAKEWQRDEPVWTIGQLKNLIKEVATEARREGIEEVKVPAQEAVKKWLKTSNIQGKPSDALFYLDLMVEIATTLERLKERE